MTPDALDFEHEDLEELRRREIFSRRRDRDQEFDESTGRVYHPLSEDDEYWVEDCGKYLHRKQRK